MSGTASTTRRSPLRAVTVSGTATVICSLPLYLTGALAVQLTEELAFGLTQLGIAVAVFRATGAVTSSVMGIIADRIGAVLSLRLAVVLAAISCFGIGSLADGFASLTAWLIVGATGKSLCQPAANRLLINNVHEGRRGIAFGVKQSAAPASSMLGGISVPVIALTIGWRWAYLIVGVLALAVIILVGRRRSRGGQARRHERTVSKLRDRPTIVTLAVAFGLGTAASSTIPTFYVDAAVRAGTAVDLAGTLLAVASVGAILTRVLSGMAADRISQGHVRLCALLLVSGAAGLGLVATNQPQLMAVGAFIALSGTWGFNGVFWYSLMKAYPDAPGKITGVVAPGGLIGGVVGPIALGGIAEQASYPLGWTLAAVSATVSAMAMIYGARRLSRMRVE